MQAARELAQLLAGAARLVGRRGEHLVGRRRRAVELAARDLDAVHERDEPLLHPVVEVAADAAALLVGGVHEPGARGGHRGVALAQGGLVAAALDLGAGARGEHRQRGALVVGGVQPPPRHHADVAEPAPVRAVHDDRQVALDPQRRHVAVGGERLRDALGHRDEVAVGDELAGAPRDRVLVALGRRVADARPAGEDAPALPRRLRELGDEGDVGVERLGEVARQRAQEGGAGDVGGAGGHGAQQIAAGRRVGGEGVRGHRPRPIVPGAAARPGSRKVSAIDAAMSAIR